MQTSRPVHSSSRRQERGFLRRSLPFCVVTTVFVSASCMESCIDLNKPVADATTAAVNAIDDAVDQINNAQSDWQQVLQDLQQKLVGDAQATLRNEVATLASRSIAQTGVELRCNADFIRGRVIQGLRSIKAKLLNSQVPPLEPAICQVVPVAVDRAAVPANIKQLEFYGYDFDHSTSLAVTLERTAGGDLDVTPLLTRPTHYAMTLPFGAGGVQLDNQSKRFRLDWNGATISTIAVVQPATPVCQSKTVHADPGAVTLEPPHQGSGDRDFSGNGPKVITTVTLNQYANKITGTVYMRARETKDDWTRAEGSKTVDLYNVDPGWRIESLGGTHSTSHTYTDSDHEDDSYDLGSGGPVKRVVYVGDEDGDDAGRGTQVIVTFNRLTMVLVQDTDCVSGEAVLSLPRELLTDVTFRRIQPVAAARRARLLRPDTSRQP